MIKKETIIQYKTGSILLDRKITTIKLFGIFLIYKLIVKNESK